VRTLLIQGACAALVIVAGTSWGGGARADVPRASYAAVGSEASVPYGWDDFCSRRPAECNVPHSAPVDLRLTEDTWEALDRINRQVNASIKPVSNFDHWGTTLDHWDYPVDGKGDCKIYALYKRKLLLDAGIPRQALLMTIVRDPHGNGHAVLTVKTDHGDFILDNLADQIRPWEETGYRFVKRQSQEDPNVWVAVGDPQTPAATAAAAAETLRRDLLGLYAAYVRTGDGVQTLAASWTSFWSDAPSGAEAEALRPTLGAG
jgi:predicted transglutaminase-like cysteine proteinase